MTVKTPVSAAPVKTRGIEAARAMTGARQAARLHQIIRAAASPEAAADAVRLALSTALAPAMRADGAFGTAVRLEGASLRALTPTPAQAATAPLAIRALVAAGDVEGALAWYQMLRTAAPANSDIAFLVLDLWPLVQVGTLVQPPHCHLGIAAYATSHWRG